MRRCVLLVAIGAGCVNEYHPEYHPVSVVSVVENNVTEAPPPPAPPQPPAPPPPAPPEKHVVSVASPRPVDTVAIAAPLVADEGVHEVRHPGRPRVYLGGNVQISGNVVINGDVYINYPYP